MDFFFPKKFLLSLLLEESLLTPCHDTKDVSKTWFSLLGGQSRFPLCFAIAGRLQGKRDSSWLTLSAGTFSIRRAPRAFSVPFRPQILEFSSTPE